MSGCCVGCGRCCGFRPSSGGLGSRGSRFWPRSVASPRPRSCRSMEPRHERIARIALAAGGRYGLALAGGYAVSAHGMGSRPSGDVDLFTSWQRRGEFPELAAAVIAAIESAGYKASVIMSAETFRRLILTDPDFRLTCLSRPAARPTQSTARCRLGFASPLSTSCAGARRRSMLRPRWRADTPDVIAQD